MAVLPGASMRSTSRASKPRATKSAKAARRSQSERADSVVAKTGKGKGAKANATKSKPARNAKPRKSIAKQRTPSAARLDPQRAVEMALAAFAHEVRTPLTGILAISDLLATSDLDERALRWAATIKASAEHLAALTTLFVDAARARAAQAESKGKSKSKNKSGAAFLRLERFDIRTFAEQVALAMQGRAEAKGLLGQVNIAANVKGHVRGDVVRLRAALENLIDNAVKFTDQGTVALSVSLQKAGAGQRKIIFAIKDSGIGLSGADIKRLFRPFAQANDAIARKFGGAGLGLFAVRDMARLMGGDVRVTSRTGQGATFTLHALVRHEREANDSSIRARLPRAPGPLHVLCVEDNPFGRVVLNTILTELGHRVSFAQDSEAALAHLLKDRFDAVLMDVVLPGEDGVATARTIRALKAPLGHVPIIGISGREADRAAALEAGMNAFLLKPVSPRAIAEALSGFVPAQ